VEKVGISEIRAAASVIYQKLPKQNNHPMCEKITQPCHTAAEDERYNKK
jgi:hypothetical protein